MAWIRHVCQESYVMQDATVAHQDNLNSLSWDLEDPTKYFAQRKRMDVRYRFAMHMVENGDVRPCTVPTAAMQHEVLIKALRRTMFRDEIIRLKILQSKTSF